MFQNMDVLFCSIFIANIANIFVLDSLLYNKDVGNRKRLHE